ncbi:MAG: hypothetical protein IKU37_02745 [Candidatus Gastranaerophilales bacterium]|nr:hypothetical protein [Candidatus Gastranaerophilales bacterium]
MNLEKMLIESVKKNTPDYIKEDKIFNYNDKNAFTFKLTKEIVEKLDLKTWFAGYKKEALVSTAGIRGPQNIVYPHDTRFPINTIGITLATLAKALVLKEKYPNQNLVKLVGCEVRYNSKTYLDIIARIQGALGIRTLTPTNRQTIPIWLASFLAFKLDLVGAEYITSSHGISVKNATKDLNNQGSQFLPNESIEFVNKIEQIFAEVDEKGFYEIEFCASNDSLIDEVAMEKLNNGIDLYCKYLKAGVANNKNLTAIKSFDKKIVIDSVGGCAYNSLSKILSQLEIDKTFVWLNKEEDPFFHGIGKDTKNGTFYDWSLDVTVLAKDNNGKEYFPVVKSLNYGEILKDYPLNTVVLITDPDHDRLNIVQIVSADKKEAVIKAGVDYVELDENRILCVFSANQSFLMIMDYWNSSLDKNSNSQYFMIKTTASSKAWDEWAKSKEIKIINTPVGFKEIAGAVKKIEAQYEKNVENITIYDVFNKKVELGANPRMIFGGEESGGMIIGAIEPIKSLGGRIALAMREKSATEAIIVASALVSSINTTLVEHLQKIYDENNIISRYDVRVDIAYYNESEPDINKLKEAKVLGEAKRTKNDIFYLALAMAKLEGKINLENIKEILSSTFPSLNFSNLLDVIFVGDGTYLDFEDKFVEIRPSGTDAKTKAYAGGDNKELLINFADSLGNYSGELNETYKKYINEKYVDDCKENSFAVYEKYSTKDEDNRQFSIPNYKF